jgi:hypothetical protein
MREPFELDFTDGPAALAHARAHGVADRYDWASLDPSRFPPLLVERARVGWTENALNEYCTAAAMGQLVTALLQARAPLDLVSAACRFPTEELVHVELCARLAMQLGGGAPLAFDPEALTIPLDPSLTPLERANELVVRLLCVGEALSLPLLAGCMRAAAHPLTRALLEHIVRDEAEHGRLGFWYLDWIGGELSPSERERLGRAAADTLQHHAPIWEQLRSRAVDGVTSEGFALADVHALGWMESSAYAALARDELRASVIEPLARHGIIVPAPG